MKPTMKRGNLTATADIWNAVISVVSDREESSTDTTLIEASLLLQYYSEIESGGHEILLTSLESFFYDNGIESYLTDLITVLEKIGAHDYALIEKKYGQEMWRLYVDLKNGEIEEDAFYTVIEKADAEYDNLNQKLEGLVETYFVSIHTELINVIE